MNQPVTFCLAFLLFSAASGCRPSVREPQIPDAVVAQTETLRTCLEQGGVGFDHIEGQDAIRRRFIDIPDDDIRKKAALSFGDMLLSVDLKALPYRQREGATRIYREYLYLAFDVMGKCGIEPSVALDYYFNGLSRYRDSCLGVSDRDFLPGESAEDSRWRRDCARKLKDDYRLTLSIFERFWLPRLSRVLPPDLHDEFRSRLEDFSSLPSQPNERPVAYNATGKSRIEALLAAQTNSPDTVRAIRQCMAEMPGLLDRLPTEEARARWTDQWERSLWNLNDGTKSYRERMGVVCAVEEATFAVKSEREKRSPNSGRGWDVVVRWLDWYALQLVRAKSAAEERVLDERDEGHLRQGIVYTRRHFRQGLLSMFRKKYRYAMKNRWFPELDKTLPPEQAAQVKAKLTTAAERIAAMDHD